MRTIAAVALLASLQACSFGNYYVLSGTDEPASNTQLYEGEDFSITLIHFDGKTSGIFLSTKEGGDVSVENMQVSVHTNGQTLPLVNELNLPFKISLTNGTPHIFPFSYTAESKPKSLTEHVVIIGQFNGSEFHIAEQYHLESKSYGWFEATRGI